MDALLRPAPPRGWALLLPELSKCSEGADAPLSEARALGVLCPLLRGRGVRHPWCSGERLPAIKLSIRRSCSAVLRDAGSSVMQAVRQRRIFQHLLGQRGAMDLRQRTRSRATTVARCVCSISMAISPIMEPARSAHGLRRWHQMRSAWPRRSVGPIGISPGVRDDITGLEAQLLGPQCNLLELLGLQVATAPNAAAARRDDHTTWVHLPG